MGLRYASDAMPGLARLRAGKGFRYVSPSGSAVRDPATLRRIKRLAIPPAWTQVWIATDPRAHIQATGRDARGRKQYRYHARWREVRGQNKFDRLVLFARVLDRVRRRVARDLSRPELSKAKVMAVVVRLLEETLIRVGNEEYARDNRSFGLTTLRDRHVKVRGDEIRFQFVGKSGIRRQMSMSDRRLARLVKGCQDLPGQQLFQYLDDRGRRRSISSSDVNAYLRETCGAAFTAKDFRTWAGTVRAAIELSMHRGPLTKKAEVAAIQCVADPWVTRLLSAALATFTPRYSQHSLMAHCGGPSRPTGARAAASRATRPSCSRCSTRVATGVSSSPSPHVSRNLAGHGVRLARLEAGECYEPAIAAVAAFGGHLAANLAVQRGLGLLSEQRTGSSIDHLVDPDVHETAGLEVFATRVKRLSEATEPKQAFVARQSARPVLKQETGREAGERHPVAAITKGKQVTRIAPMRANVRQTVGRQCEQPFPGRVNGHVRQ